MGIGAPAAAERFGNNQLLFYTQGDTTNTYPTSGQAGALYSLGCDPVLDPTDCGVNFTGGAAGISYSDLHEGDFTLPVSAGSINVFARPGNSAQFALTFLQNNEPAGFYFEQPIAVSTNSGFVEGFLLEELNLALFQYGGASANQLFSAHSFIFADGPNPNVPYLTLGYTQRGHQGFISSEGYLVGVDPTMFDPFANAHFQITGSSVGSTSGSDGNFYLNDNTTGNNVLKAGVGAPNLAIDIEPTAVTLNAPVVVGSSLTVSGVISAGGGSNVIYYCSGGASDGILSRGNSNLSTCPSPGVWVATSLHTD